MPTHVLGLARPAHLRIPRGAEFDSVVELVAPIVRLPDDGEDLLACARVQCHRGAPASSTAECAACSRLLEWRADAGQVTLRCRWSHHDRVTSRMTPAHALISVSPETTCAQADAIAQAHSLRHLIVLDGYRLAGVVCRCDLAGARAEDAVAARMAGEVFALSADANLGEAAAVMRDLGVGILPVVSDAFLLGVITRGDLRRAGAPESAAGARPCARCRTRPDEQRGLPRASRRDS